MEANKYQRLAARTLIDKPAFTLTDKEVMILWNGLALVDEAGEVAGLIKKGILHRHGLDTEKLKKELGDVCWYLAALCTTVGFDFNDVMQTNIDKLLVRYPDGYSDADSIARVDVAEKETE